uniref:Ubiquitin-like protease family profile domain-containing protein n=1 Tax=Chenopodium quinoa TaxID=63459 RepID=A0A803M0D2_CHEQI
MLMAKIRVQYKGPSKCNFAVVKSGARKGGGVKGGGVKAVNKSQSASSGDFMENLMMEYMKLKSRKRKGKLEQSVYRKQKQKVPKLEGHKVLSKGEVLKTHHDNVGKYPNIVCRVESFCDSVKLFYSRRKQLVEQMGFGGFLELDMDNIPRKFCYWLMARVLEDGTMVFGEGEVLPLCASQVRAVLGIPMGSKPVPMDIGEDEDKIMLVKSLYDVYGVGPKQETISLKRVSEVLFPVDSENNPVPLVTESDEEEFMVAFLIVVLGKLLCTTTNSSNLAAYLIPSLTVATQTSEYDWCTFTMDCFVTLRTVFKQSFCVMGFGLDQEIFYLDHLHRRPLQWGVLPRVKVWNSAQIKAALMEDKISRDEYGKLLALDIAYGEEHPLDPRDEECMRRPVTAGTATLASHNQEKEREKVDDIVAVVLDKVMEKLTPRLETFVESVVGRAFSSFVTKMTTQHNVGNEHAEKIVPVACTGDNMEVEDEQRTCKLTVLDKRVLNFVRGWKELKNENAVGPSIIECDGMDASQRDCYRVLSLRSRVGNQYVRMASVLYTKTWSEQHTMKRVLLDPSYSHFVCLGQGDFKELGQKYAKFLLSFELSQIQSVFVPVLDTEEKDAEHWFCLALDMKGQLIWMIDSMYDDAYERHEKNVNKLIEALGELFQLSDPTWEEGTISTWGRDSFPVTQPDTCSCGAIMLVAIKHCVRSFDVAFHMDKIHTLRQNLFLSDVNNDLNQMKPKLEDVLPKERRGSRRGDKVRPAYYPDLSDLDGYLHKGVSEFAKWLCSNSSTDDFIPQEIVPIFDLKPEVDLDNIPLYCLPTEERHIFIGASTAAIHVMEVEGMIRFIHLNVFSCVTEKLKVKYHRVSIKGSNNEINEGAPRYMHSGSTIVIWNARNVHRPSFLETFYEIFDYYAPLVVVVTEARFD